MNLIIGNTSQLTPYFKELNSDIVTVTSRDFTPDKVGNQQFDRVFLTFAEQRTFLTSGFNVFKETNVDYTVKVISEMALHTKTFVVYLTSELWNNYTGEIDLNMPFYYNFSPYIGSKEMLHAEILKLRAEGVNIKMVYPFNFNSPYRREGFLFSKFMNVILNKEHITVGDLNFTRDIIHPRLIVEASLDTESDVIVGSGNLINVRQFYVDLLKEFSIIYEEYVTENSSSFVNTREPYFLKTDIKYNNLLKDTVNDIRKFKDSIG
jgi:nucleoside-diphosphate-sugar epimerase